MYAGVHKEIRHTPANDTDQVAFLFASCVMRGWKDRYDEARRHVDSGRTIIERQQVLIAQQKASGADTKASEELLAQFESSQAIFEDDLDRIRHEAK